MSDGPTPPAGLFDKFLAARPKINTCKTQSYAALLSGNNWSVLRGSTYVIGTETTALPEPRSDAVGFEVLKCNEQRSTKQFLQGE